MHHIKLLTIAIAICSFAASVHAADELTADVRRALDKQLALNSQRYGVVGQSVVILRNNKPYYEGMHGFSNIEFKVPVERDHRFPSYSVTKLFTSTLIMKFVEQGKIDIGKSIRFYLPYLPSRS